jgi:hypothetical protein
LAGGSSSISSSNIAGLSQTHAAAQERPVRDVRGGSETIRALETRCMQQWCRWSIVIAAIVWFLAARGLLWVLYLQPIRTGDWWSVLTWKPAIACGLVTFIAPWVWRIALRWGDRRSSTTIPWSAGLAVLWLCLLSLVLVHPRGTWFFVEWAKVRTPNPSFARNTLMWAARDFEHAGSESAATRVTIVGSSQIYAATDLAVLQTMAPEVRFQKQCLAGFGPMQYPWLVERILAHRPHVVVCWLSEFDFYREDEWPVNRLRWASSLAGLQRLITATDVPVIDLTARIETMKMGRNWGGTYHDLWTQRGAAADLTLAAVSPIWRNRDHLRQTLFGYWWDRSRPPTHSTPAVALAESADLDLARENLKQNMGRKTHVATNFRSFEQFVTRLKEHQIDVVIIEGETHPEALAVCDPAWRIDTRQRLIALSDLLELRYIPAESRTSFTVADFADPYHLNTAAQERFSRDLARLLTQTDRTHSDPP